MDVFVDVVYRRSVIAVWHYLVEENVVRSRAGRRERVGNEVRGGVRPKRALQIRLIGLEIKKRAPQGCSRLG
jgi:hypothetical protein